MKIKSAALIYFSPTSTTKTILLTISKGMGINDVRCIDATIFNIRSSKVLDIDEDIIVIGVPVYEERIPRFLNPFLNDLNIKKKPIVLVAVYGNIGEGIALDELKKITENSGSIVVAAASFIGEHSFSTKEFPIAEGRPDSSDLDIATNFGEKIIKKLETNKTLEKMSVQIPQGKLPLMTKFLPKNSARLFTKTPDVDMSLCNHCGLCAKLCPFSAINNETLEVDNKKCIRCFRCVKECPKKARKIILKKRFIVSNFLSIKSRKRKEPKLYL